MNDENTAVEAHASPPWQPLSGIDRRVAGVLVEKAKTTPDTYPLSLNAVTNACNQKSNRMPVMNLTADEVEQSLDRLRGLGAVGLVEGYGRVSKYRHYLYEWLGVDKVELAVMAELLLRGPQTIGELRGRAARMEPIRDLAALQPILASLTAKGLVIALTREGRGQVVTHALYQATELERQRAQYGSRSVAERTAVESDVPAPAAARQAYPPQAGEAESVESLRRELDEVRSQLAELRSDISDLATALERTQSEFHRLRDELGG